MALSGAVRTAALAGLMAGAGCTGPGHASTPAATTAPPAVAASPSQGSSSPPTATRASLLGIRVRLVKVAYVKDPVSLATRPGDPGLYVGVRPGIVRVIVDGRMQHEPVLDISSEVELTGGNRGLLGMTFSPDGAFLYLCYSDRSGADHLSSFRFEDGRAIHASERDILVIPQPEIVHHGGDLHFDGAGNLWMSTGDATQDETYAGRSQSPTSLLGKMLRIRPTPDEETPYRIPSNNPAGPRREVVASGLRNPWRFSVDAESGDVWIGDVGQHEREEIDLIDSDHVRPANFGWDRLEGSYRLNGGPPPHYSSPLYEYAHANGGCAVIGGIVYRGAAITGLQGAYVYADYCEGTLTALIARGRRVAFQRSLGVSLDGVSGFGVDADGELYALSLPYGVFKLVPAA